MAGEFLIIMALLIGVLYVKIWWQRRRRPEERLGQWLMRTRRQDVEGGYKDIMLASFALGLFITGGIFHLDLHAGLERPEWMLLALLCVTFTLALPLLIWLIAMDSKKRLKEEDEHWRKLKKELLERDGRYGEMDDDDLDGR